MLTCTECHGRSRQTLHNDKWSTPHNYITPIKTYAPNIRTPVCIKSTRTELKGGTSIRKQKIWATDHTDLHRTFHPTAAEQTSWRVHMEHFLGQKICYTTKQVLTNLKRHANHLFWPKWNKLQINSKRIMGKFTNMQTLAHSWTISKFKKKSKRN